MRGKIDASSQNPANPVALHLIACGVTLLATCSIITHMPVSEFESKTSCSRRLKSIRFSGREPVRPLLPRLRLRRLQPRAAKTLPPRARLMPPAS